MWHLGMNSNMNFPAPVAAIGFLLAVVGVVLCVCALAVAVFLRKPVVAKFTAAVLAAGAAVHFGLLFGFSLGSHDRLLAKGEEKYFCEIDCHLAYSIVDVDVTPGVANSHYVITLRTRFDQSTTSPRRPKDMPLTPSPRTVELLDAQGNRFVLASTSGTTLSTPLIPGQAYTTQLAFELPRDAKAIRLLISTAPQWPDHVVIGDENSWFHKKTYFSL